MAVVNFDRKELNSLMGKRLTDDVLENEAPMMGCDVEVVNEDSVEIEIFPNRPDLLSVEGFARSFRQFLGISKGLVNYDVKEGDLKLNVDSSVEEVRPCVSGGAIRNVELTEGILRSLMQVQEKIHATFGRGRRKVAIGIHDMKNIEDPFTYKAVEPESVEFVPLQSEEKMNLLEIKEKHPKGKYASIVEGNDRWPIIVDRDEQVLSFPPVINGTITKLTEDTEDIFIDVTGTDQQAVDQALNLIVTELIERGAEAESVSVRGIKRPDLNPGKIGVDLGYINRLLNLNLSEGELEELLSGMGFGYEDGTVLVPCYRVDIMHPIDIVEDLAISYGYENFNPKLPDVGGVGNPNDLEEFTDEIRDLMVGFGFQEVMTPVLSNRDKQFTKMDLEKRKVIEAEKPLSENYNVCRRKLLPGLLGVLEENKHRSYPQKIFETGDVVVPGKGRTGGMNRRKVAGAVSAKRINYADLASVVDSIMGIIGVEFEIEESKSSLFMENRGAKIIVYGEEIGKLGEIHPKVLENWVLEKPTVVFELNLDSIMKLKHHNGTQEKG
ncbi:MAG: phenylalanine--tRNA ligase subunit beta [Candidatus Hadarchaeota archaeon]